MKIVDLFCGCGGFGLGAKQAGFEVVVAVDIDDTLQSAYKRNFPRTRVVNGDLSTMDENTWQILLSNEDIDGVIGGPPCQGYSRMGKCDVNDPRRSLLYHFFRTVNIIKPKFFIMENVEGLLDEGNFEELDLAMSAADKRYELVGPIVLDASDFGVPTKRKRVVVVGYDPRFINKIKIQDLMEKGADPVNVRDAISDIPSPTVQNRNPDDYGWLGYKSIDNLSEYAKKMRSLPELNIGWPLAVAKLQSGLVSGNFDTVHTDKVRLRYRETHPGSIDKVSKAKRLAWDGVCPTLRAGTGSDKGSHQAVRPLHPEEARVITVREAARLQGFPDWFCFHKTKWHSFRMIGNSVSPMVAESILTAVRNKFLVPLRHVANR